MSSMIVCSCWTVITYWFTWNKVFVKLWFLHLGVTSDGVAEVTSCLGAKVLFGKSCSE